MQIVIDITDKMWKAVQDGWVGNELWHNALANGTPLPKGHGRLIDASALKGHTQVQPVPHKNGKYVNVTAYYQRDIDITPTIIEADEDASELEG